MTDPSPATFGPAPLRSALKSDGDGGDRTPPTSGTLKAVQIAEPVPEIEDEAQFTKTFRAGPTRRLSGKPASRRSSLCETSPAQHAADESAQSSGHHSHRHQYYAEKLLAQVSDWLEHEKRKKLASLKPKSRRRKSKSPPEEESPDRERSATALPVRERSSSVNSQSSDVSFEKLESILQGSLASLGLSSVPRHPPKLPRRLRANSKTTLHRTASSDTDYVDGDAIVPSCDAWLDNSKTMSYTGGTANEGDAVDAKVDKENDHWLIFKNEIIRIAHTLKLKGWRRVPLGSGDTIAVERLSGALTNAVYVVTPPADLAEVEGRKPPPKVLLRVYGPQAEHLIDRENELKVLQRLARKKIGPRLLGTFQNGRFEQFFNAITLTPAHLRETDTTKQIAKRMRELHEGIELLPSERDGGPAVWKSWDQWVDNVAKVTAFLDRQYQETSSIPPNKADSVVHAWKANGYVCGVPFAQFLAMVMKYRKHVVDCYKSEETIKERMVFAHNDTQYGNILRIKPDDEKSPLLQAANKHKQLVVIDFEYAAANVRGLEFANHFTEWTYNYHDPVTSHACNHERYPTPDEQRRFIKSYIEHRPQVPGVGATVRNKAHDSGSSTPSLHPTPSSSSIVDFMLDARVPPGGWTAAERAREEQVDLQVRELMDETRLWRPGNSAFWIAWGIVQSKVPGLDANNEPVSEEEAAKAEEELGPDEFDYLSYAQDRALFFWGDCVKMGLAKPEDLPEKLRLRLKMVDY